MAFSMIRQNRPKPLLQRDSDPEQVLNFPFLKDSSTVRSIKSYGRIMFIIRGPPGGLKYALSSSIEKQYESAVVCSASTYFDMCENKNKQAIQDSHDYCQLKVEEECAKGTHPIVVKNTHMKKDEVKPYIDLANKFGYTVIMAIILRKLDVNPEVLKTRTTRGLSKEYLKGRLSQWQEYYPLYLGWFLSEMDSLLVLNEGKNVLASLICDGKFCNAFKVYTEEDIWTYFKARKNVCCVASYCGFNDPEKEQFYLSDEVQDSYGKYFALEVQGYLISKSFFLAIVAIPRNGRTLIFKEKLEMANDNIENLCNALDDIKMYDPIYEDQLTTFNKEFNFSGEESIEITEKEIEKLNINDLNIITLGQNDEKRNFKNVKQFLEIVFSEMINSFGNIDLSEYCELDNGTRYHRLSNDIWFVHALQSIAVNTIFTGRYQ